MILRLLSGITTLRARSERTAGSDCVKRLPEANAMFKVLLFLKSTTYHILEWLFIYSYRKEITNKPE